MIVSKVRRVPEEEWATALSPFQCKVATYLARQGKGAPLETTSLNCIEGKPDLVRAILKRRPSIEIFVKNDARCGLVLIFATTMGNDGGAPLRVAGGSTIETAFGLFAEKLGL